MKKLTILIFIFSNFLVAGGQSQIQWQKSYGGSNFERAYSAAQTGDGGYIVVGETTSTDGDVAGNLPDYKSAWILRLDQNGDTIWTKCFHDAGTAYAVEQTADDGFVISCSGFTLLKLSVAGQVSWSHSIGDGSFLDNAYTVSHTGDDGYIAGGELWGGRDGFGTDEWFIAKYDQSGDTLWTVCFEDELPGACYSVKETSDGGYIAAGSKDRHIEINPGEYQINYDFYILKLNSSGDSIWSNTFGGSGNDIAYSVLEASDGGFVLIGSCGSDEMTKGDEDGWIIKVDENGNFVWQKFIGGSGWDQILSGNKTKDNGYVLCGFSISYDGDLPDDYWGPDYWIVKTDESGNVILSECFGGDSQDYGQYALQTKDGGYLMAGRSWSDNGDLTENKGFEDAWIVKLASTSSGIHESTGFGQDMEIYPNPVRDELFINKVSRNPGYLSIYTIDGKLVKQRKIDSGINRIDVSELDKGSYLLRIDGSKDTFSKKLIKQ